MNEPNHAPRTPSLASRTDPAPARPVALPSTARSHGWRASAGPLLAMLAAIAMLAAGVAWGQNSSGDARSTADEAEGRVPGFEVVERTTTDRVGVTLHVEVDVDGLQTPSVLVVGPGGTMIEEDGSEATLSDLPQGDYLIAATAPQMRMVYGTLTAADGDELDVALRLFHQRVNYADESDTPILGLFTMDIADNDDDERGAIHAAASPSAKMAVIGSDGYLVWFATAAESHAFESIEPGRYVVAMTLETRALTLAHVVVGAGDRVSLDVEMPSVRP